MTTEPKHPSHANRDFPIPGADPRMTGRRYLTGYSDFGNGPTPIYGWLLLVDGHPEDRFHRRIDLVLAARASGNGYLP